MTDHHRVSPRYWTGERRLWNDQQKLLGLYLLTCEHRTSEGIFRLPAGYIQTDLGWTHEQVVEAMDGLVRDGFVAYDEAAEVALLPKALKRQRPTTDNQIRGAIRRLQGVPKSRLWVEFMASCEKYAPSFHKALSENGLDLQSHVNGNEIHEQSIGMGSVCADAQARPTHSSSSSSSSTTPLTPQGGNAYPERPSGARQRDLTDWRAQVDQFAAEHFPGTPGGQVAAWAGELRVRGTEPTVTAMKWWAAKQQTRLDSAA